jgi:hypothetical protein
MSSSSWYTAEEKQQINQQYRTLAVAAANINACEPSMYQLASLRCYRQGVLAKYVTNEYCDIIGGNCDKHISFLDNNKNTEPTVNFYNTNHGILMVQMHELVKLPPKERGRWEEFKLPLKLELKAVDSK